MRQVLRGTPLPAGRPRPRPKQNSDYKVRLLEKQRLRAQYDISETQLRRAFEHAHSHTGKTGEVLVTDLETRLDALVMRSGLARTIYQARQMVTHQHMEVNGARVDRPSYRVQVGDVVAVADRSRNKKNFQVAAAGANAPEMIPPYLQVNHGDLKFRLQRPPGPLRGPDHLRRATRRRV